MMASSPMNDRVVEALKETTTEPPDVAPIFKKENNLSLSSMT